MTLASHTVNQRLKTVVYGLLVAALVIAATATQVGIQKAVIYGIFGIICFFMVVFRDWFGRYRARHRRARIAFDAFTWAFIGVVVLILVAVLIFELLRA